MPEAKSQAANPNRISRQHKDIHQLKLTMYKMLVLKFTETRTEQ